jgi:hypothetical protein
VVRVDEVVRDGRKVGLYTDKEAPAKVEHVTGRARRLPGNKEYKKV